MPTLLEASVNIISLILLLSGLQALFGDFGLVGGGISIHNKHVANTICPMRP